MHKQHPRYRMGTKPFMYSIYIAPKMSLEKTIETCNININLRIRYIIVQQKGSSPWFQLKRGVSPKMCGVDFGTRFRDGFWGITAATG
jgi:hypothetical protein